jgi:EmrB/QacA subfamily drug resistance transporter
LEPFLQNKFHTTKWLAMGGLGMGVFMATLDASIVNISLPTLVQSFNTDFATIQWVVLSYSLVLTSLMLMVARLGDMLDKKRIWMTGLALFTLGSLLCGLSPSVGWLIAFRALQGLGATMMQALGIAMITEIFPANERGRALGLMGSVVSIGIAIGPPLGGILIGLVGWRWIFLVNIPLGLITALIVTRFVPQSLPTVAKQRFDLRGAMVLMIMLCCYALGMTLGQRLGFDVPLTLTLLSAAGIGLAGLLVIEARTEQPMIDLSLFRNPLFGMNLLMGFLVFVVLTAGFILPFLLELVQGYSPQVVGLMMMASPVTMGLASPIAGILSDRYGSRLISMAGLAVIIAGCLSMTTLTAEVTPFGFVARMIPLGIGFGLFQSPNNSAIMGAVPRHRMGIASGLLSLSRTLGQSTGLPLMGALFAAQALAFSGLPAGTDATTAPPLALVAAVAGTYRIGAVIVLAAIGIAWWAYRLDRSTPLTAAGAVAQ